MLCAYLQPWVGHTSKYLCLYMVYTKSLYSNIPPTTHHCNIWVWLQILRKSKPEFQFLENGHQFVQYYLKILTAIRWENILLPTKHDLKVIFIRSQYKSSNTLEFHLKGPRISRENNTNITIVIEQEKKGVIKYLQLKLQTLVSYFNRCIMG